VGVAAQLALTSDAAVDDLLRLTEGAVTALHGLFGSPFVANPTFQGSTDVGGADADFIVDGCLVDIKTTKSRTLAREHVYQPLGYVLLDYEDEHGINGIGYYSSRVPALTQWPLDQLIDELSTGEQTVAGLRKEFSTMLRSDKPMRLFGATQRRVPPD
jgi:hypothetical protein